MRAIYAVWLNNVRFFLRNPSLVILTLVFPWLASGTLQIAIGTRQDIFSQYYVFLLIVFSFWFMLNMGVREIARESALTRREFFAGLRPIHYLLGKSLHLVLVSLYVAAVLACSAYLEWVDWSAATSAINAKFVDPEQIAYPLPADRDHPDRTLADTFLQACPITCDDRCPSDQAGSECRTISSFVMTDRNRLQNSNPVGVVVVKSDSSWHIVPETARLRIDTWTENYRGSYSLGERAGEQLMSLFLLDYLFLILILSGMLGAALGMFLSTVLGSVESAAQTVPFITILQILLSEKVICPSGSCSTFGAMLGSTDTVAWIQAGLAEKLSLFTVSRHLFQLAQITVLRDAKAPNIGASGIVMTLEFVILFSCLVGLGALTWLALARLRHCQSAS